MPSVSRFFDRYYLINVLVILSYGAIRSVKEAPELERPDDYIGISRELGIIGMLSVGILSKLRKTATFDEFVARCILFGKTGVVILLWYFDKRIMAWYLIIYVVLYFTLKPPEYEGPADVVHLNPESFKRKVLEREGGDDWLVYFHADWCENCNYFAPMFADLSIRYGNDDLMFGKIDVGRYQDIADEFTIDNTSTSYQLPSFIMFKKGTEAVRLPQFKSDGQVIKTVLDEKGVIAVFELGGDKTKNPKKAKSKKDKSKKDKKA